MATKKKAAPKPPRKKPVSGIIQAKTSSLVASDKNPRFIRNPKYLELVQSLRDFPEMLQARPFVGFTREDGKIEIIGGNQRLKAAKELKYPTVPVSLAADGWSQAQRDEFMIKDNLHNGDWDFSQFTSGDWDVKALKNWGVDGLTFTAPPEPGASQSPKVKVTVQDVECPKCHHHFKAETNSRKTK